jgi:hypothetical protein
MKQVWHLALSYLRIWRIPFKDYDWDLVDQFMCLLIKKENHPRADTTLKCTSFDWITTWKFLLPLPMVAGRPGLSCKLTQTMCIW